MLRQLKPHDRCCVLIHHFRDVFNTEITECRSVIDSIAVNEMFIDERADLRIGEADDLFEEGGIVEWFFLPVSIDKFNIHITKSFLSA